MGCSKFLDTLMCVKEIKSSKSVELAAECFIDLGCDGSRTNFDLMLLIKG